MKYVTCLRRSFLVQYLPTLWSLLQSSVAVSVPRLCRLSSADLRRSDRQPGAHLDGRRVMYLEPSDLRFTTHSIGIPRSGGLAESSSLSGACRVSESRRRNSIKPA